MTLWLVAFVFLPSLPILWLYRRLGGLLLDHLGLYDLAPAGENGPVRFWYAQLWSLAGLAGYLLAMLVLWNRFGPAGLASGTEVILAWLIGQVLCRGGYLLVAGMIIPLALIQMGQAPLYDRYIFALYGKRKNRRPVEVTISAVEPETGANDRRIIRFELEGQTVSAPVGSIHNSLSLSVGEKITVLVYRSSKDSDYQIRFAQVRGRMIALI